MTFRQPSNGQCKIGRKVEFINPLRYSSKKHYWGGGVGNYGMLTTQQIEILNEMKQKEKRAHLYDMKSVEYGLNYSVRQIKYGRNLKQPIPNSPFQKAFDKENSLSNQQSSLQKAEHPKAKRSASELRSYDEEQPHYERLHTIDHQFTPSGMSRHHGFRAIQNKNRRVKTVGVEQLCDYPNPQPANRIDQMFEGLTSVDKIKNDKKHLRMDSGNIRVSHSPETIKNVSNPMEKSVINLQPNIMSDRLQKQTSPAQLSSTQKSRHTPSQETETTKSKILKRLTRQKFRRDHSPTFCNSIEYPLKYFRHI